VASEEIVKRIADEVIKLLETGDSVSTPERKPYPDAASFSKPARVMVILTAGPADLTEVRQQLSKIAAAGVKIDLFIEDSFPAGERQPFRDMDGVEAIYEASVPPEGCYSLITRCDALLMPTLSLDTLNQITDMKADSPASRLAVEALGQDKQVVAPADIQLSSDNLVLQQKFNEKLSQAGAAGIETVPLHELSYQILQSSIDSGKLTEVSVSREKIEGGKPGVSLAKKDDGVAAVVQSENMRLGTTIGVRDVRDEVAGYIDHTMLKPDVTRDEIVQLCEEARDYGFASVCINPSWVSLCHDILQGTPVKVCTVIGFPLGATTTATKVQETREAIANGADEIDMVMNVGALKEGDNEFVRRDIAAVKEAAGNRVLKVILETGLLSDSQKATACRLCKEAGADFVKTSTGFGPGGAKMNDIALMRRVVGGEMGVKASGGVHNFKEAVDMISAGASRIGASAGVAIVSGGEAGEGY
jgi:deoxyribose-phosphate aldolase